MPEIIPLHASLHYKSTFDIEGDPQMEAVRKIIRSWAIDKVLRGERQKVKKEEIENEVRKSWFFKGNSPETPNYFLKGHQIRTACIPGEDIFHPVCWAFEMIHPDSDEDRRWSVEITLKNRSDANSTRIATVIKHYAKTHFMGPLPELPTASTPKYIFSILKSKYLTCKKGDSIILPRAVTIRSSKVRSVFNDLKSSERMLPFVFVTRNDDGTESLNVNELAKNVQGNANVYLLADQAVLDELNYYLGETTDFCIFPNTARVFLPRLDFSRPENSRSHRYFAKSFIRENGEETVRQFITNGLSRFASTQAGDLLSFQDIFSERRKHKIGELSRDKSSLSSEMSAFIDGLDDEMKTQEKELQEWKQLAEQYNEDNRVLSDEKEELRIEKKDLLRRVSETDQLRIQCEGLQAQVTVLENLSKFPDSLVGVLTLAGELYSSKIEISQEAFDSAKEYFDRYDSHWKKIENLNLAWTMISDFTKILYPILFDLPDGGNPVLLLKQQGSSFDLALNEGKQTAKNRKLMNLRKINYEGKEIDISAHLKHGNRDPSQLRLHYYQDNEKKKLIIGHFGKHLDNASTKNQ